MQSIGLEHAPKNNPRELSAWCMYDWANSVYSLAIATAIFPIYFVNIVPDQYSLFGFTLPDETVYSYSVSFAYLLIVLFSPLLSGIADARALKKVFMGIACTTGAVSVVSMCLFNDGTIGLGITLFIAASFCWALSEIFYNSFLPDIATEDRFDRLSARGYSMGYIGSVIQLVLALALVIGHDALGLTAGEATRISFAFTGIWWGAFGLFSLSRLHQRKGHSENGNSQNLFTRGFQELIACSRDLFRIPILRWFLITFLLYDIAVQTVMYVATIYGTKEIKLDTDNLIAVLLVIQLIAIPGAFLFSRLSERKGNIFALRLVVVIWIGICIAAYFLTLPLHFYILAAVVGLVMGAVQSVSRATYTKLIPPEHQGNAAMFSFYSVMDKVAIILGTFTFGLVNNLLGSMRQGILFLIFWLVLSLLLLAVVPWQKLYARTGANRI